MPSRQGPMGRAFGTTQLEPRASTHHRMMLLKQRLAGPAAIFLVLMVVLRNGLLFEQQLEVVVPSQNIPKSPPPPPEKLYPDLRLCRFSPRMPQRGLPPIQIFPNFNTYFQCEGPEYDKCAAAARAVARNSSHHHASPMWSQPGVPLVRPGSSLLFIGNSHTRQIYETLVCQYQEDILSTNPWGSSVTLRNDIFLQSSINHPWHYDVTTNLTERFLSELGHFPNFYDAIILGDFNGDVFNYNFSLAYTRPESFL
jgi:hypothetical protein